MSALVESEATRSLPKTASEIMTQDVVSVPVGTTVAQVAGLLAEKRISAVPVVDSSGSLLGIVSEGDLLGRSAQDRIAGREWWLEMLAGQGQGAGITAEQRAQRVEDVMHAPVITVGPKTPLPEIADTLQSHRVKRVVVVRESRPVGIVSRADLLRAVALEPANSTAASSNGLASILAGFFGGDQQDQAAAAPKPAASTPPPKAAPVPDTAEAFSALVEAAKHAKAEDKLRAMENAELARNRQVREMLQQHLEAGVWTNLLDHARHAAENGKNEFILLRFPCALCSDGGRRIGVRDQGWEKTLRGKAADLYDRWERDLMPKGFGLSARMLDDEQGLPGDIELYLTWA